MTASRLALFDLDNTLIDRAAAFARWVEQFLDQLGIRDPQVCAWIIEEDADGYTPKTHLFDAIRIRLELRESTAALIERYQREAPHLATLEPTVADGLRSLRAAGYKIGIVTNGSLIQEVKLRATGIDRLVDGWAISDIEGVAKPAADLFEIAAQRAAAASPLGAWMVGDHPRFDIGGGRDAGCRTAWINRDRPWTEPSYRPDLNCAGADSAIDCILAKD